MFDTATVSVRQSHAQLALLVCTTGDRGCQRRVTAAAAVRSSRVVVSEGHNSASTATRTPASSFILHNLNQIASFQPVTYTNDNANSDVEFGLRWELLGWRCRFCSPTTPRPQKIASNEQERRKLQSEAVKCSGHRVVPSIAGRGGRGRCRRLSLSSGGLLGLLRCRLGGDEQGAGCERLRGLQGHPAAIYRGRRLREGQRRALRVRQVRRRSSGDSRRVLRGAGLLRRETGETSADDERLSRHSKAGGGRVTADVSLGPEGAVALAEGHRRHVSSSDRRWR